MMRTLRNIVIYTTAVLFMLGMPSCGVGNSSPDLEAQDTARPI